MEIQTRNCQIITIPTKTHDIILASKKDIPDAEKIVKKLLEDFEIINVSPKVQSGELVKQSVKDTAPKEHIKKSSVLADYLKIKDYLPEVFTASDYYEVIKTIKDVKPTSVYADFKTLVNAGKIVLIEVKPMTYQKVHPEDSNISQRLLEDRKNIIETTK